MPKLNVSYWGEATLRKIVGRRLYQNICPEWYFTHNLDWHKGGRIIVAWKSEDLKVNIVSYHSQYIHLYITPPAGRRFMCIFVYGATEKKNARMDLFKYLDDIDQKTDRSWLILGDFNCIANLNERIGSTPRLTETLPLR